MNILVSGSSGFIGSALVAALRAGDHRVVRLVRPQSKADGPVVRWDPDTGTIDRAGLEGIEAVIHLAGASIAERWTPEHKTRIRESRVRGTRLLSEALAEQARPPGVLICASATGYYGHRGDEWLTEESPPGTGFLADVCQQWEAAAEPARQRGIRVVNLRIGIVLGRQGGALARMLLPFRLGLGGTIGCGRQYWSWIALDDLVSAFLHALVTDSLSGPVNVVSPVPVTNREFTRTLGRVLARPTVFPLPAPVARFLLGEMADELLLASARVRPVRLLESGFQFRYPDLESALRHLLKA
ncbi:MAG TPA: TIGR01777 family oxidoreductase [Blastocatellia bacterium]|nr:TIGR01777 family oxidoreductase [Blastocatellia bacterium]